MIFLFAYAILRSIPNKLGGVVALIISIVIIISLSFSINKNYHPHFITKLIKFYFEVSKLFPNINIFRGNTN